MVVHDASTSPAVHQSLLWVRVPESRVPGLADWGLHGRVVSE